MTAVCFLFLKKRFFNFLIKSFYEFCIINKSMFKCIVINMLRKIK